MDLDLGANARAFLAPASLLESGLGRCGGLDVRVGGFFWERVGGLGGEWKGRKPRVEIRI